MIVKINMQNLLKVNIINKICKIDRNQKRINVFAVGNFWKCKNLLKYLHKINITSPNQKKKMGKRVLLWEKMFFEIDLRLCPRL